MSKWLLAVAACAVSVLAIHGEDKKADVVVKIVHVDSGKVLGIEGDSEEAEAHCILAKDEENAARQWKIVADGDWVKIVHMKSGKLLDVNNASTDEGAHLIIWDDKGDGDKDNQRFKWDGKGDEKRLTGKGSSLALDVDADGHVIQKKSDDKNKKQLWKVVEVKAKK